MLVHRRKSLNRCSISHENAMILTNIDTQENIFIHSCIVCTELKHFFFINIKYHSFWL